MPLCAFYTSIVNRPDRYSSITMIGPPMIPEPPRLRGGIPLYTFDLPGASLAENREPPLLKQIFWWSGVVSPHTPKQCAERLRAACLSDVLRTTTSAAAPCCAF